MNLFLRDTVGAAAVSLVEPTTVLRDQSFSPDSGENANGPKTYRKKKTRSNHNRLAWRVYAVENGFSKIKYLHFTRENERRSDTKRKSSISNAARICTWHILELSEWKTILFISAFRENGFFIWCLKRKTRTVLCKRSVYASTRPQSW